MRPLTLALIMAVLGIEAAAAQQPSTGGFVFAYAPTDRAMFEAGYRRHLDWHRAAGDSLSWIGWDVLVGPRPGVFVDGVFGVPFGALDVRVDPGGDQADAAANVLPHADPVSRDMIAVRRDLSSATPLEDGDPTALVEVVWYDVVPGQAERIEAALAALHGRAAGGSFVPYTVYERVAGAGSGFVLMVWRNRLSSFDEHGRSPRRALDGLLGDPAVVNASVPIIRGSRSEVWSYRRDLSYLGSAAEEH